MVPFKLSFAGAGRVAASLCHEMHDAGHRIIQVISETENNGPVLAASCNAGWSASAVFLGSPDIIIVAVPDHRLHYVLSVIKCDPATIVAHTAGSYGLEVFPESIRRRGVFYPLQTFTSGRKIDFKTLPFIVEASDQACENSLKLLAESISEKVYFIDSERRKRLHLAAVFVCNFINHMLTIGKKLCSEAGVSFSILEPLIRETISKALESDPENSQTGPAVRNDTNTIKKHMDLLSFSPQLQGIYREISESIQEHYKKAMDDKL